jgi:glutathione S-transferase
MTLSALSAGVPEWDILEEMIGTPLLEQSRPSDIDSVLDTSAPEYSTKHLTFFRERHGWCPYSERVWLALEMLNVPYDTVRIDNTGQGPRPSYFSGTTPQIRWPDTGRTQSESLDLVSQLDLTFNNNEWQSSSPHVKSIATEKYRDIMPKRSRPSSRAAFLFQNNGDPIWKRTFEETLQATDDLLSKSPNGGPFFAGSTVTIADIAWIPFLERYRYQLPCLHDGLDPYDSTKYPHLVAWYDAIETAIPAYSCRVKGNAASWRKVLLMAGFGNSGDVPENVVANVQKLNVNDLASKSLIQYDVWRQYASVRPHVAETPELETAWILYRNRQAIIRDAIKQSKTNVVLSSWISALQSTSALFEEQLDTAMRQLVHLLISRGQQQRHNPTNVLDFYDLADEVVYLARYLDERMCVPRDMGCMCAATIQSVATAAV